MVDAMPFSVSMCVYGKDNPEHFKEAMESVINQTLPPEEVVLVVDGPIPDSIQTVIDNLSSQWGFIRVIYLQKNVGHGEARRTSLKSCRNHLVAIMDADDICVPNRFEEQIECFKKDQKLSIVGGNIKEFIGSIENVAGLREVPQNDKEIKAYMKKRCPFNQMTVMMRKADVEAAGGYMDWFCNEDYFLWIRMALHGFTFKNLNKCLVYVRVGEEMYQRRGGWQYFMSEARLQNYMRLNGIIGSFRFLYNIAVRLAVQVIIPNRLRGFLYRQFFRTTA